MDRGKLRVLYRKTLTRPLTALAGELEWRAMTSLLPEAMPTPRISFCTTIMNRLAHLKATIKKNIEDSADSPNVEFVLLNYACPDPETVPWIKDVLRDYIKAGRLKYFYFPFAKFYSMPHSRNLAFRLATGDILCNIDADNFVGKDFATYVARKMKESCFLQGPADGRGLGGRICIHRMDFMNIAGYDERFHGWGYDDTDIAIRLRMTGVARRQIYPERFLSSIGHARDIRVKQYSENSKVPSESKLRNKLLSDESVKNGNFRPNGDRFGVGKVFDLNGATIEIS